MNSRVKYTFRNCGWCASWCGFALQRCNSEHEPVPQSDSPVALCMRYILSPSQSRRASTSGGQHPRCLTNSCSFAYPGVHELFPPSHVVFLKLQLRLVKLDTARHSHVLWPSYSAHNDRCRIRSFCASNISCTGMGVLLCMVRTIEALKLPFDGEAHAVSLGAHPFTRNPYPTTSESRRSVSQ
jgi:hypothetical protein